MSIYTKGSITINFNNYFNRLAITSCDEFISLSLNSFNIWMKLIEMNSNYDCLTISQNGGGTIEMVSLFGSYSIKFNSCKNLTSHILISKNDAGSIYSQRNYILSEIKKRMEKKPNQLFERNGASSQVNKGNKKIDYSSSKRLMEKKLDTIEGNKKKICLETPDLMKEGEPLINGAEGDVIDTLINSKQTKQGNGK